jgi:hypothetical protein
MRSSITVPAMAATACLFFLGETTVASRSEAADVAVEAILVEPASPTPEALCGLRVRLKNGGTRAVSNLRFKVEIDGKGVPQYDILSFALDIDAGATREVLLHNFWTSAAVKPFDLKVELVDAQWVEVKREGTTTTITPVGPVTGLPVSGSLSVKVSPPK